MDEDANEKEKMDILLPQFRGFVLDLFKGLILNQVLSTHEKVDSHVFFLTTKKPKIYVQYRFGFVICQKQVQLMDDLHTLKIDNNNGRMIEFPLETVKQVGQCILSEKEGWFQQEDSVKVSKQDVSKAIEGHSEHVVVLKFTLPGRASKKKLAFAFEEFERAKIFRDNVELLSIKAQQTYGNQNSSVEVVNQDGSRKINIKKNLYGAGGWFSSDCISAEVPN